MIADKVVGAVFTRSGLPRRLDVLGLSVLLYPASEIEDGLAAIVLRRRDRGALVPLPLIGQGAAGDVVATADGPVVTSRYEDLLCTVSFRAGVAQPAWFWHLTVHNVGEEPAVFDVVHLQDVALAGYSAVRTNEYYVSQYLDLTPVPVEGHGTAIGVRQNMPGTSAPWALIGCIGSADAWSTDALQLTGRGPPAGSGLPGLADDLPSRRWQHEHTLVGLQHGEIVLAPGDVVHTGFFGIVVQDHPEATGAQDAVHAVRALADPAATSTGAAPAAPGSPPMPIVASLFTSALMVAARDLTDAELTEFAGADPSQLETADGALLSAFTADGRHLVSAAKERRVLRPHGHLLRSGAALTPDEYAVTVTTWMAGTFLSQLTQGHVSRDAALSVRRTYLGLQQAGGLRIFVASPAEPQDWSLLGPPSAWQVGPAECHWWYATDAGMVEVFVRTPEDDHVAELTVRSDRPVRLLVAAHLTVLGDDGATPGRLTRHDDVAGSTIEAPTGSVRFTWPLGSVERVSDDRALFPDGFSRDAPWLTVATGDVQDWTLTVRPDLVPAGSVDVPAAPAEDRFWSAIGGAVTVEAPDSPAGRELQRIEQILPWFAHDALVHYLSPRGLEQFTGGAWGTRDVCQGPVGLLLALGRHSALREVVLRIMAAQQQRGDWPQAFDFYARYRWWGQADAHGDVVYWPLLALGDYLSATADGTVLAERMPYVGDGGPVDESTLLDHVVRALDVVEAARIPGTALPAYGHGDWNDSLQPADPALAARLCSTWTVTLQAQALGSLARGLTAVAGNDSRIVSLAQRAVGIADAGTVEMLGVLVADGVLAGYGLFADDGSVQHLVHPRDQLTGLTYSVLPMIHAIAADLLDPAAARSHLDLIERHLTGPDGARLFDRPVHYSGGPMRVFQRAEGSTFFGREIGIMYMHAHLRYAEALARFGDAEGFLRALALANPIGVTDRIPSARRRQSTTYYSSSDAVFADRYQAAEGYQGVLDGSVELEGGWRVYSSGPGIYLRLVVENLFGIRQRGARVEIDPVLPAGLDGLTATLPVAGGALIVRYAVGKVGSGPTELRIDGRMLDPVPLENRYRTAGVSIDATVVAAAVAAGSVLEVTLG